MLFRKNVGAQYAKVAVRSDESEYKSWIMTKCGRRLKIVMLPLTGDSSTRQRQLASVVVSLANPSSQREIMSFSLPPRKTRSERAIVHAATAVRTWRRRGVDRFLQATSAVMLSIRRLAGCELSRLMTPFCVLSGLRVRIRKLMLRLAKLRMIKLCQARLRAN